MVCGTNINPGTSVCVNCGAEKKYRRSVVIAITMGYFLIIVGSFFAIRCIAIGEEANVDAMTMVVGVFTVLFGSYLMRQGKRYYKKTPYE